MMIKPILLFFLGLLTIGVHSQGFFGAFAFSWLGGFCKHSSTGCDTEYLDLWDHQSFTIHGFWPFFSHDKAEDFGLFNISFIDNETLLDDMENYWPPKSNKGKEDYFLWKHQWEGHGWDYADALLKTQPALFQGLSIEERNEKLQKTFFSDVISIYKSIKGAIKYPTKEVDKTSLANIFGISKDQLKITTVTGSDEIREVKVCIKLTPQGHSVVQCKSKGNDRKFILPSWKKSDQRRVTADKNEKGADEKIREDEQDTVDSQEEIVAQKQL